jgi:hypothetical protein
LPLSVRVLDVVFGGVHAVWDVSFEAWIGIRIG